MSVGSTLLELQEIDLTLMRDKEQLQNLAEIAELARRRKLYIKLKGDVTKYFAQRKDVEESSPRSRHGRLPSSPAA